MPGRDFLDKALLICTNNCHSHFPADQASFEQICVFLYSQDSCQNSVNLLRPYFMMRFPMSGHMAFWGQVTFKSVTAIFNLLSPRFLLLILKLGRCFMSFSRLTDYYFQNTKTKKRFADILLYYIIYITILSSQVNWLHTGQNI